MSQAIPKMTILRIVMTVLTLTLLIACQKDYERGSYPDIIATWKTEDPKYADRFFQITDEHIIFGTGHSTSEINTITAIHAKSIAALTVYEISYSDFEDNNSSIAIIVNPKKETMTLQNQPNIFWRKHRGDT